MIAKNSEYRFDTWSFSMKELFSSLSATVFYPLVSLMLPGLTAISGWFEE